MRSRASGKAIGSVLNTRYAMAFEFIFESMVRGYHVYKHVWDANIGETLSCEVESGNASDPYAVAVKEGSTIVGHVPRAISAVCNLFLRRGGTIVCHVNGTKRYSADLVQGGLEIPCKLVFTGDGKDVAKVTKLLKCAPSSGSKAEQCHETQCNEPLCKNIKQEPIDADTQTQTKPDPEDECTIWLQLADLQLSKADEKKLVEGGWLNDKHMEFAQRLLKQQFPSLGGLQSTLLQCRKETQKGISRGVQIVHSRGNHWIVVSTINCKQGEVLVFDSLYTSIDESTKAIITSVFQAPDNGTLTIRYVNTQKQADTNDCGLFAIASATAIAFGSDPSNHIYHQGEMRSHLHQCFVKGLLTQFP